jgi:hypothetical protein
MKIAKIEHNRCDSYEVTTWVWAPDDWTFEQFDAAVERARTAYQAVVDAWSAERKVADPGFQPDYKKHPDKTVREVDEEFAVLKEAYKSWSAEKSKAQKGFAHYLAAEGMVEIWNHEPELKTELYWGHQHGKTIRYDETRMTDKYNGQAYPEDHKFMRL